MTKNRLEAFSDGVIAILITIMVFDIKAPTGDDFSALLSVIPFILSYMMSFLYLGIYWNNHHHMLHATKKISGGVLWANQHLLFWLSLMPFATNWLRASEFASLPACLYGVILFMSGVAYKILYLTILHVEGEDSQLRKAVGVDIKGNLSVGLYIVGIAVSYYLPLVSIGIYVVVALMWLVPDRRIENQLHKDEEDNDATD